MDFDPDSRFTSFPINILVGLDAISDIAGVDLSNSKEVSVEMVEFLALVKFGNKVIPFGTDAARRRDATASSSSSRTGRSYLSMSENKRCRHTSNLIP